MADVDVLHGNLLLPPLAVVSSRSVSYPLLKDRHEASGKIESFNLSARMIRATGSPYEIHGHFVNHGLLMREHFSETVLGLNSPTDDLATYVKG